MSKTETEKTTRQTQTTCK